MDVVEEEEEEDYWLMGYGRVEREEEDGMWEDGGEERWVVEGWRRRTVDCGGWRRRMVGCGGIVKLITLGE